MFDKILIWLLVSKVVVGQFNGDFWWLNNDLANHRADPAEPKFERLTQFDTDESAKIIFRENDLYPDYSKSEPLHDKSHRNSKNWKMDIQFQDKSALSWPDDENDNIRDTNTNKPKKEPILDKEKLSEKNVSETNSDVLEFKFPETDNTIWKGSVNSNLTSTGETKKNISENEHNPTILEMVTNETPAIETSKDKNSYKVQKPNKCASSVNTVPNKVNKDVAETESICTFMKKFDCSKINGIVYVKGERDPQRPLFQTQSVCCIIPLSTDQSKIHFRDFSIMTKRYKRSDTETNHLTQVMKQRNALLQRNFVFPSQKAKPSPSPVPTNNNKKIISTDDEDVDPYWNIKNSNFKTPKPQNHPNRQTSIKSDYTEDYVEDYTVELPAPGLVGIYSDGVKPQKPGWIFSIDNTGNRPYGDAIESEEDGGISFGYGPTIDPRLAARVSGPTSKPFILGRPVRLSSTTSYDNSYNAESHTISYQSNPDFQVLQGFKLLNLVRNKSRIYRTGKRTTTTESIVDNDSEDSVLAASLEDEYDSFDNNIQPHRDCGRAVNIRQDYDSDKQIGEAEKGSHPWLAMAVLTKRRQSILCYATLVHPRAAVTSADCVYGRTSPGEITVIVGVSDLSDDTHEGWQKRTASTNVHPRYRPGELLHNLAILYWKQPLRLTASVQPVCLSDPHVGDDCKIHGWGGFDQDIRPRSRWQRAFILTPRACSERLTSNKPESLPDDAFCASVRSQGTVTGIGGPLVCTVGTRHSAVGIAVWRDHVLIMSPIQEWTVTTLKALGI